MTATVFLRRLSRHEARDATRLTPDEPGQFVDYEERDNKFTGKIGKVTIELK